MKLVASLVLLSELARADIELNGAGHGQVEFRSSSGIEMTLAKNISRKELTLDGHFHASGTVIAGEKVFTPSVTFPSTSRSTDAQEAERPYPFDNSQKKAINYQTLGPNLLSNGQMRQLDENGKPKGYDIHYYNKVDAATFGNFTSVSPLFRCFEGRYVDTTAEGFFENTPHSTTCDDATQDKPFYFGRYTKGSRLGRGGMVDGWMSSPGGRIGRIQGFKALASGECVRLGLPINSMMSASDMRIRMWVKITKGSISWSSGVCGGNSWVTKAKADAAEDGCFFYDSMMHSSSGITSNWGGSAHQGNLVMKGENADGSGEFDITIGMLHVSQLEWQDTRPGQSSNNWQGSYLDNLASRGIVIDVATGNMGIGMSNPSALPSDKLEVNGNVAASGNIIASGSISASNIVATGTISAAGFAGSFTADTITSSSSVSTPSVTFPSTSRSTDAQEAERPYPFDNSQKKAINYQTLGPNLLSNGQMRQLDENGKPKGYDIHYYNKVDAATFGNFTSVSPLFRCFEGRYVDTTAEGFFENTPHSTT